MSVITTIIESFRGNMYAVGLCTHSSYIDPVEQPSLPRGYSNKTKIIPGTDEKKAEQT